MAAFATLITHIYAQDELQTQQQAWIPMSW
jgi:hypothetical protein